VGAILLAGAEAFASQPGPEESAFWHISKGDQDAGYVLGTIHSEDPRVLDFSSAFIAQLTSCAVFAMELVPDMPTLSRLTELMQYPDLKPCSTLWELSAVKRLCGPWRRIRFRRTGK
jgi:uncharacterized protein YbaP (TraB family)